MLSNHWSPAQVIILRVLTLAIGAFATWTAWRAAQLWRRASEVPVEIAAPTAARVSWDDSRCSVYWRRSSP